MNAIEIKNLTKKFKNKVAIDNLSLNIKENELFGLLGDNGAGKTTLINILTGLIIKDQGEVKIMNYSLDSEINKIKEVINISPQDVALSNNLTVIDNINFFKEIYQINDDSYINNLINLFKLDEYLTKKVKILSGGYKRRVSILISLISRPKILFLDEPTLGLDVIARKEMWNILSNIKNKTTIILTSHYLEEIEQLSDNLCILSHGKLKANGSVEELKNKANKNSFEDAFIYFVEN